MKFWPPNLPLSESFTSIHLLSLRLRSLDMKVELSRLWKAHAKPFFTLALCQLLTYFLFSVNARVLAQGRIKWTFWSDIVYALVSYEVIKRVGENKSLWGRIGFVLGGAWGSVFAIQFTKRIFGQ